jgi:hypothetical protein
VNRKLLLVGDVICFAITTGTIALLAWGITTYPTPTNSGTQPLSRPTPTR